MRLMYIASVDFYTKPNPSFHLMESMIEDLLSSGIEVYFIGISEEGIDKHIPEHIENYDIFSSDLVSIPKVKKSSFARRYFEGVKYSYKAGKYIKRNIARCDLIFVQSSPTVLYTICRVRNYAKKQKIVYNVQDMFPGSSIATGVMPWKWMQKAFYFLQRIAYRKSDVIVAISEDMKKKLIEQKVPNDKVTIIYNWFDDKSVRFVEWEQNRFVKKYNMSHSVFYVQYAGTIGYVFDYVMVLSVAEALKNFKDIVFQIIGEGSQRQTFMDEAKKRKLNNIHFLPLENQEMVSDVYSACSICIIPLKKGVIGNSVPSKTALLMACRRPIVITVDADSDCFRMINEHAGIAVSNSSPNAAAMAILELKENADLYIELEKHAYDYGQSFYSRKANTRKYIDLFQSILEE